MLLQWFCVCLHIAADTQKRYIPLRLLKKDNCPIIMLCRPDICPFSVSFIGTSLIMSQKLEFELLTLLFSSSVLWHQRQEQLQLWEALLVVGTETGGWCQPGVCGDASARPPRGGHGPQSSQEIRRGAQGTQDMRSINVALTLFYLLFFLFVLG